MKTSNYLIALAALSSFTFVSCSDNDFVNQVFGSSESGQGEITFGAGTKNITRAETIKHTEAAARLNNNFVLYGFKTNAAENMDGTTDEKVFDNYNVNYVEGSNNTTESNTAGWEYVGYNPAANSSASEQTIKYWDHSANQYIFSAFSGIGVTGSKTLIGETDKWDKGWTLTIPQGGSLADLYASDRVEKASDTDGEVTLTFYSAVTKIRFGVYETVPGYSIKIDNFYYTKTAVSTADANHFAIDGKFNTLNPDAATSLKVTYYNDGVLLNHPKIDASAGTKADYMQFGTNIQAQTAIGTTSPEATYDKSEMEYTYILPYADAANVLKLKVDYTLTSTDGSGEKIKVTGATATVPANFTQWKNNFAYTYIFKISDNTNGHTGTGDPGLYPITFDACVVNAEDGIQQTITSVSEPSITTYQKGTIVTEYDEYYASAGDIYFSVMKDATLKTDLNTKAKVFEVVNNGTEPLTENVSENYLNNFCVFTAVTATQETAVPLADGTDLTFAANTCYKFTPEAGKTYVIQYDAGDAVPYDLAGYNKAHGTNLNSTEFAALTDAEKTKISGIHYKVVKVEGTRAAFSYAWTAPTDKDISTTTEALTFTLNENSVGVLGAIPSIKIKSGTNDVTSKFKIEAGAAAGEYKISLTPAAIAEDVNGSYTIDYNNGTTSTFTVNVVYALATSPVTVVKNGTGASFTLTASGNALSKAVILNLPEGVTITESGTAGTYNVAASSKATVGTYTTTTVAGQALTIKVDSYSFSGDLVLTKPLTGDASGNITLSNSAGAFTTATVGNLGSGYDAGIASATVSNGVYTFTTVAGGSYDIAYENAKAKVTVNAYTLTSDAASNTIARATGATNITVKCNGNVINASTASVECTVQPASSSYSLTTNGQVLRFGNATVAGNYTFQYKIGTVVVAEITITVN